MHCKGSILLLVLIVVCSVYGQSSSIEKAKLNVIMDKRDDRLKDFHAGFNKVQKIIESNLVKGGFSGDKASKKALDSTMVLSIQFNIYTQQYLDLWQMNSNIKISRREYVDSLATIIGIQYFTVAFDSLFENNLKKIEAIWKVDK